MNLENDEEVLDFMTRLLERLHQAGFDQQGSHYQFVYVASQPQAETHPCPFPSEARRPVAFPCLGRGVESSGTTLYPAPDPAPKRGVELLPEVLRTEKAMAMWRKVQAVGYVDEDYQPTISRTQAALLADAMAERLSIREKWKVFETLWNRKYMRSDYNLALTQQQSLDFQDELKSVLI